MKGEYVIVKECEERPLIRRVWGATDRTVYVLSEACYEQRANGDFTYYSIGFPREDVFVYDEVLYDEVQNNKDAWDKLVNWDGILPIATD